MIFVVHGEDTSRSREAILSLQKKFNKQNKIELVLKDTSPSQLYEAMVSFDMFGGYTFVVFDISAAGKTNLEDYVSVVAESPAEAFVVIYSSKELGKTNAFIKSATKFGARVLLSTKAPSSNVFKFVDAVFTKNRKVSYKELKTLLVTGEEPFYIFSMLLYGLRSLSYAVFNSPALNKMAPFVRSKVMSQANSFDEDKVKKLYKIFYELDLDVKSGKVSADLLIPIAIESVLAEKFV